MVKAILFSVCLAFLSIGNTGDISCRDVSLQVVCGAETVCRNMGCPNDGIPALDGTGFQNGKGQAGNAGINQGSCGNTCISDGTNCPNDGVPALDGTGYQKGHGKR